MFEEHGGAERRRTRGIDVRSRLKSTKGAPDGVGATCVSMAVDLRMRDIVGRFWMIFLF